MSRSARASSRGREIESTHTQVQVLLQAAAFVQLQNQSQPWFASRFVCLVYQNGGCQGTRSRLLHCRQLATTCAVRLAVGRGAVRAREGTGWGQSAVWQSFAWLFGVFLCMSLDFSALRLWGYGVGGCLVQAILISEAKTVAAPPAKAWPGGLRLPYLPSAGSLVRTLWT